MQTQRPVFSRLFSFLALLYAIILGILGVGLLGGGGYLLFLGGSAYYVLMGAGLFLAAIFFARNALLGAVFLVLLATLTIFWAVWESGFFYWALFPRLFVPGILATIGLLLAGLARSGRRLALGSGVLGAVLCAVFFGFGFVQLPIIQAGSGASFQKGVSDNRASNWEAYGRTNAGTRFAPFTQINRDNVAQLSLAWQVHTGDKGPGVRQDTPLQIGDTVYTCTPNDVVLALDADTGAVRWRYDTRSRSPFWQRCRGLGYIKLSASQVSATNGTGSASMADGEAASAATAVQASCQERIINTTIDARMIAFDAHTGQLCEGFGAQGIVDLKQGMGEIKPGFYFQTSAPTIARGKIIIGGWVRDNYERDEPSGVIRAFDAVTGQLVWAWDMGHPDWTGAPPAGQSYTRNTPNMWSTAAYDDHLGLVYVPLGNDTPDYNSMGRNEISSKYNSSIVALDIETGRPRWSYQTVHHDIWDYDLPSQPALMDLPDGAGGTIPALLQSTKRGQLFLLNRETGKPVAQVVEKPVPQKGAVPGETLSPTQPYSVGMPTIGAVHLDEKKMWGATMFDQMLCRIAFKELHYDGEFTPPGLKPSIQQPGNIGGLNWGSLSYDPVNHLAIMNDMRVPSVFFQITREDFAKKAKGVVGDGHGPSPQYKTPYGIMTNLWLSVAGLPCSQPPYGTITAVDMISHEIRWQIPAGTAEKGSLMKIRTGLPIRPGGPAYAGTLTTAGGLIFYGAVTTDSTIRAYDEATGKELWAYKLPTGASATPMSYISPKTGRQYIVLSVGGMPHIDSKPDDLLMAFALPEENTGKQESEKKDSGEK